MSISVKVVSTVLLACVVCMVATFSHHADGASNCEKVLTSLQPCEKYLKQGGTVPSTCCNGVRSLNSAATTTALKRSYCECLKSEAKALGVKTEFASKLPKICNVNIGYPISYNVDCSRVQ